MITKNNWLTTNITDRLSNPKTKVRLFIEPYEFEEVDFKTSAKMIAEDLKQYDKLFLALSGGADSDSVCQILFEHGVNFTPILIDTPANKKELQYAYKTCDRLGITPHIISMSYRELINYYIKKIYPINGNGINVIANIKCAEYALEKQGKLVTGVNIIGGDENGEVFPGVYEFDFYLDLWFGENFEIPFHLYSIELVNATIKFINKQTEPKFKADLYDIEYREKMPYMYDSFFIDHLITLRNRKQINTKEYLILEKKEILLEKLKKNGVKDELFIDLQIYELCRR